jgi:hypothetical protein
LLTSCWTSREAQGMCVQIWRIFSLGEEELNAGTWGLKRSFSIIWIALVSSSIFYVVCECLVFVLLAMFFLCKRASRPSLPNFDRNPQIVQHLQHSRMNGCLPKFDRNSQIVQYLPIFKNKWYQQAERTTSILPIRTRVLVFGFKFPCSWVK